MAFCVLPVSSSIAHSRSPLILFPRVQTLVTFLADVRINSHHELAWYKNYKSPNKQAISLGCDICVCCICIQHDTHPHTHTLVFTYIHKSRINYILIHWLKHWIEYGEEKERENRIFALIHFFDSQYVGCWLLLFFQCNLIMSNAMQFAVHA